jgi:hypothetical protein
MYLGSSEAYATIGRLGCGRTGKRSTCSKATKEQCGLFWLSRKRILLPEVPIRLSDFGGMESRSRSSRAIPTAYGPYAGYPMGYSLVVPMMRKSPELCLLASGANPGSTIRIWSPDGHELQQLHGHTNYIYSVAASPSGELVSCGEDRTVRVWRGTFDYT